MAVNQAGGVGGVGAIKDVAGGGRAGTVTFKQFEGISNELAKVAKANPDVARQIGASLQAKQRGGQFDITDIRSVPNHAAAVQGAVANLLLAVEAAARSARPTTGAATVSDADVEKMLAQLVAGAAGAEVLETASAATAAAPATGDVPADAPVTTTPAAAVSEVPPVLETKNAPTGTDWARFSSVAMSKVPVHTPKDAARGSVLNARISVLKKDE